MSEFDITQYEMSVGLDAGYYHHLTFRLPGYVFERSFQLVTWPGALCITGDMGTYVFRRLPDMFEFFRAEKINPSYWGKHVEAADGSGGIRQYSPSRAEDAVLDLVEGEDESNHPGLREIVRAMVGRYAEKGEDSFRVMVDVFEFDGFTFSDFWEVDLTEFSPRYLWCCEAIRQGVRRYDQSKR